MKPIGYSNDRRSLWIAFLSVLCILIAPLSLPSQNECCQDTPPMCECGAYCDGYQWSCAACSPIIVDVADNGFSLTSASGGVWFDLPGMGTKKKMSWTSQGSDDGFLALDRNGNGMIDNGLELFGNFTPQPPSRARNGFLALAMLDTSDSGGNGDGLIDALDAAYAGLRIWVDANHNGVSEPEELFTLPQAGVHSMDLRYQQHRYVDEHGNEFRYRAQVRGGRQSEVGKWAYDVFLVPEGSANTRPGARLRISPSSQVASASDLRRLAAGARPCRDSARRDTPPSR
jgi:hypothetical protein